ncbi:cytochrome C [Pseudoalteromonas sp. NBT06-2]|uniref:c-type cytochrome n=1 Tax=Pseudoalteromonas sp. NBT06-2 TaxID=2025950 RepID=UPI000BA722C1|nr:cytochrome c [Pseudoalteromonas sp. NBT06-2]PAJ73600.1 cytochrome C [Pseudoalteromonas sp. NBT06-2]
MNLKPSLLIIGLTAGLLALPTIANTAFEKPSDAVEYRQSAFSMIGTQIGDMGAMLKGKVPFNAKRFAMRANNAAALSKMPWEAFIPGTEIGTANTSALSEIWSDNENFMKKATVFQKYADELATVAATGDQKKIGKAFGNWAKGCKDCHKSFKD